MGRGKTFFNTYECMITIRNQFLSDRAGEKLDGNNREADALRLSQTILNSLCYYVLWL